jgi:hypothetical protein
MTTLRDDPTSSKTSRAAVTATALELAKKVAAKGRGSLVRFWYSRRMGPILAPDGEL